MSFRLLAGPFLAAALLTTSLRGDDGVSFKEHVEPILSRCVRCHSGDAPAGGLNLTSRAGAIKGGESGAALVPKDVAKSLIISMVAAKKMPPTSGPSMS